jgi:hypothetical protein
MGMVFGFRSTRRAAMPLAYELLAEIFKIYVSFPDTLPEILLQVCRSWNAVASNEPVLWTKFIVDHDMINPTKDWVVLRDNATLTHDWIGIFKRRLARAGPSLPFQVEIITLNKCLLPVIDVISGGAPDYIHLPRWETLYLRTCDMIRPAYPTEPFFAQEHCWGGIADLISQPTPSLRRLTLQQNKIDFHAFPDAPNLEELNIIYSRSPAIGQTNSFPNLKKVHITYPTKYPLSLVHLSDFSLQKIETLIIGGEVEIGQYVLGSYPSLTTLELTGRVPHGIIYISAPRLRHLILPNDNLFCLIFPPPDGESQHANPQHKNRQVLEMLASRFPTVEILEVHKNLKSLVSEMSSGKIEFFTGLKELRIIAKDDRPRADFAY